jgi:hypothetical protein
MLRLSAFQHQYLRHHHHYDVVDDHHYHHHPIVTVRQRSSTHRQRIVPTLRHRNVNASYHRSVIATSTQRTNAA